MNIMELREKRAAKLEALDALINKAEGESRGFSAEEKQTVATLEADIRSLDSDIATAEIVNNRKRDKAAASAKPAESKLAEKFSLGRAVNQHLSGRYEGAEAEMHAEAERDARRSGVALSGVGMPSWYMNWQQRSDWNVTTPADGGYTVPTDTMAITEALRPQSVLTGMGIQVYTGLQGNIDFPVDTAGSGAWEGEVDAGANYSPTIGRVQSSPKRFGAIVTVSKQLLVQSNSISDTYLRSQLERTIGTAIDKVGIYGGGSGEPVGILGNSGISILYAGGASGSGVNANGTALVWADIVNLYKQLITNNALYGASNYYLTTPNVLGAASKDPKQSSGTEGNFIFTEKDNVYGMPLVVSPNVPSNLEKGSSGATLSAMIFGNFSGMILNQWGPGLDLVVDPYTAGANTQVKLYANVWVDTVIPQPQHFVAIKDIVA